MQIFRTHASFNTFTQQFGTVHTKTSKQEVVIHIRNSYDSLALNWIVLSLLVVELGVQ